jgi:protein-S-isoprenylcysteine O-methyltransferase Ste14
MFSIKIIGGILYAVVYFGILLFAPAATLHWWRAWVVLGVVLVNTTATMLIVFPGNEGLLDERYKGPLQKGQPLADKIITLALVASFTGLVAFIPLDVFRFHLLGGPGAVLSSAGLVLFAAGWGLMTFALRQNTFAAPVVKYQQERHQRVIQNGPYAVVRHPMYTGAVLLMIGLPLWLQSWAGTLLAIVPIATLVARIFCEERLLRRELEDYGVYAAKVRYRLIPLLW